MEGSACGKNMRGMVAAKTETFPDLCIIMISYLKMEWH